VPVKYNGSVARLAFGPVSAARVRRWLGDGDFDVLHIHEPVSPSLSMLALWAATGPIVATFHTSNLRSRAMQAAYPFLRPSLEKISARIAVSEDARRTVVEHVGGDAVVIPNGVYVDRFARAAVRPQWQGRASGRPWPSSAAGASRARGSPCWPRHLPAVLAAKPGTPVLVLAAATPRRSCRPWGPARLGRELLGPLGDDDKQGAAARRWTSTSPAHGRRELRGIVLRRGEERRSSRGGERSGAPSAGCSRTATWGCCSLSG
jgi:phosphatidylinositol alpha-mannosyltransferase